VGYIVLLASKAGLITGIVAIIWAGIVAWRKGVIRRHVMAVCSLSMAALITLIFTVPLTSDRIEAAASDIVQSQNNVPTEQHEAKSSTELRSVTWSASWELMQTNFFGTGVGSATNSLNEIYLREGEDYAAERKLNSHNQFFQIGVEYGWLGLTLFILFLFIAVLKSFKLDSFMYQGLLGMTLLNFLFESCLEVQAGVVFFYFFLMLFSRLVQSDSEKSCI
jgi:O-antigen ligase